MGCFKVKKWAKLRSVDIQDFVPGWTSDDSDTGKGAAIPFQGKILCLGYVSDVPAWGAYDPATHTFDGPTYVTKPWWWHNPGYGNCMKFEKWGEEYVVAIPLPVGYYIGRGEFYGWTSPETLNWPNPLGGGCTTCFMSDAGQAGVFGGEPCMLSYQYGGGGVAGLYMHTLAGPSLLKADPVYISYMWGSPYISWVRWESYYKWRHADGHAIYAGFPITEDDPYLFLGSTSEFLYAPGGGGYLTVSPAGSSSYRAHSSNILEEQDAPWASMWDYRVTRDGVPTLDEHDLDGETHSVVRPVGGHDMTYNGSLGWYVQLNESTDSRSFDVYVMDPHQPAGRAAVPNRGFSPSPVAWVGEYALGEDLKLEHVLPFPDSRDPSGAARPPQSRTDGHILGSRELFQQAGSSFSYKRDLLLDLSSYPTSDPDWWWPGQSGNSYPGMWELWAGQPTVGGRMPDSMFGWLNPLGQECALGLGVVQENLRAEGTDWTHKLSEDMRISGTGFVSRLSGTLGNRRREIRELPGDNRLCYCESGTGIMAPPRWTARVGRIVGNAWTTLIDFDEMDTPGLGETDWTIWSVVPIPPCRALPTGGFLVGATLYFDPWSDWEYELGDGTTFHYKDGPDTGNGWVPAKLGYIGPLEIDTHAPILRSAYDEWTAGRSLYGPDALLVYSNDGEFIECLNNETMYPPDGREIVVTPNNGVPRLIYRVYRWGTYSDCAEGWDQYHGGRSYDIQAPLYVCYDLEAAGGQIVPGCGLFRGFFDMYLSGEYYPCDATWRWNVAETMYEWEYPKLMWAPPVSGYVREAIGGSGVTLLGGNGSGRTGVRGVGGRHLR